MSHAVLEVQGLQVVYDQVVPGLRGVDLTVHEGEIVALLGPNGSGKTTLIRALTGLLPFHKASITSGFARFRGHDLQRVSPVAVVRSGAAQVMEGRRIFAELTVQENLDAGAASVRDRRRLVDLRGRAYTLFPVLGDRRHDQAGYLSGGEQQMLAISRALMCDPTVLLLDEPSMGLAPKIVETIRDVVARINADGTTVLLVEQNAAMALSIADRAYILETGVVAHAGTVGELRDDPQVRALYLGSDASGRRSSYREAFERNRAGTRGGDNGD